MPPLRRNIIDCGLRRNPIEGDMNVIKIAISVRKAAVSRQAKKVLKMRSTQREQISCAVPSQADDRLTHDLQLARLVAAACDQRASRSALK